MKNCHGITEMGTQPASEDRSERDLRNQHEGSPPSLERRAHCTEVDFSFSAAGYAVQQESAIGLLAQLSCDSIQCILLRSGQCEHLCRSTFDVSEWIAPDLTHEDLDQTSPLESADHRTADVRCLRQPGEGHRFGSFDQSFNYTLLLMSQRPPAVGRYGRDEAHRLLSLGPRDCALHSPRNTDLSIALELAY